MNEAAERALGDLLAELSKSAGNPVMHGTTADQVRDLVLAYRVDKVEVGTTIIDAELGMFYGNYSLRPVLEGSREQILKYEKGNYDYVDIHTKDYTVLFTDGSGQEPYNRQSVYYVPYGWNNLTLIQQNQNWREFEFRGQFEHGICFGVWGFKFNNFWNYVRFGICLKNEHVSEFLSKLRTVLEKN